MKKIISVCKTHFDIGFTDLASEVVREYSEKMLKSVITTCEATKELNDNEQFKWTMSAWPLLKMLEGASVEDKKTAEELIEKGQLLTHALPYTIQTEFWGEAELNRLFVYSKKLCDRYHLEYPKSAKMTDVPGHTWLIPSLLAKAGVKFMHVGINPGSQPVKLPPIFWWEGPDGSRVLMMYSRGSYSSDFAPPDYWKIPVWIWLRVTNDNTGPQTKEDVLAYERVAKKMYGESVEFTTGSIDDFYNEISKYDLSFLPVVKQDFADSWIHGIQSYPKETSDLRRNRRLLTSYEKYRNLYADTNAEIRDELAQIYDNAMLYGEHTMGLNVIVDLAYDRLYDKASFNRMRKQDNYLRMEASWKEQSDRSDFAVSHTEKLYSDVAGNAAFNPSTIPFKECVNVDGQNGFFEGKNAVRIGNSLYSQVSIGGLELAETSSFTLPKQSQVIDCGMFLEIRNDDAFVRIMKANGLVSEYYDNKTKKNYAMGIGEYQYDVCTYDEICDYLKDYAYYFYDWIVTAHGRMGYPLDTEHYQDIAKAISVEESNGAIKVVFRPSDVFGTEEYGNAEQVEVLYSLFGNRLNIKVNVIGKQATPMVEATHFNFALNFRNPTYKINKVGSIVDPEKDIPYGANNILYCLENYVDISDGTTSLALISHDAPLFSIGEQTLYKFSPDYKKRSDCKILVNLENTMWGTNYPQWIEGDFSFEFDLLPHAADESVVNRIENLVYPPVFVKEHSRKFGIRAEGAELLDIKSVSDSDFILRLKRIESVGGTVTVHGDFSGYKLYECDLFERKLAPIAISDQTFSLALNCFETKSVLIEKEK